jgi:hypothetical protein
MASFEVSQIFVYTWKYLKSWNTCPTLQPVFNAIEELVAQDFWRPDFHQKKTKKIYQGLGVITQSRLKLGFKIAEMSEFY